MLDPSHPAASISFSKRADSAPWWRSPHLDVRAYPKAWLSKPEQAFPNPPYDYTAVNEPLGRGKKSSTVDMSASTVMFNKNMHMSKFIRYPIKRKLRTAVELIITRGARVDREEPAMNKKERRKVFLAFDESDAGADKWMRSDWTYTFIPKTELFLMSVNEVVGLTRTALATIKTRADMLEASWRSPPRNFGATSYRQDSHQQYRSFDKGDGARHSSSWQGGSPVDGRGSNHRRR